MDTDGAEILSETFSVLSLKEMKLQAMSSTAGAVAGEEPEEEERMATMAKAVLQAAQKKVVSQVSRLNPIIASVQKSCIIHQLDFLLYLLLWSTGPEEGLH